MEKQVEDVLKLMEKIERELKSASKSSYFGSMSAITGIGTNTKENVLELIQDAFDELLPLLYVVKDNLPIIDFEKIILEMWDLKEKTNILFDES